MKGIETADTYRVITIADLNLKPFYKDGIR